METSIHTDALPDELQGYIHEDFRENECFYWKIRDKLFETYRGKWIAIHDGEIIAVSNNLFEVTKQVGRRKCHAYITKVGEEDKIMFKRRRVEFAYNTDYPTFALPQACVAFSKFSQSASLRCENVIPDTGSDG